MQITLLILRGHRRKENPLRAWPVFENIKRMNSFLKMWPIQCLSTGSWCWWCLPCYIKAESKVKYGVADTCGKHKINIFAKLDVNRENDVTFLSKLGEKVFSREAYGTYDTSFISISLFAEVSASESVSHPRLSHGNKLQLQCDSSFWRVNCSGYLGPLVNCVHNRLTS